MAGSAEGTSENLRAIAVVGLVMMLAGCGGVPTRTAEDAKIADELIGRWTGAAVDPPERSWFEFGAWDVWFGAGGDFSAVISTGPSNRFQVHLDGPYRVDYGTLYIDQSSLAGTWKVVERSKDRIEMVSGDMRLVLARRFGT